MARQDVTKTTVPGGYTTTGTLVVETAEDATNHSQCVSSGNDLIVAHNTDSSSHNVTVTSTADERGRTGHITNDAVAAGTIKIYGPFPSLGWVQSDGKLYFQADSALVKFAVIALSG